jgi:hypothetical protein
LLRLKKYKINLYESVWDAIGRPCPAVTEIVQMPASKWLIAGVVVLEWSAEDNEDVQDKSQRLSNADDDHDAC